VATKDVVGSYGERVALNHLREKGFAVLDSNWRC
jgi:Holliday junction resolvase-like predicted endonuclease